MDEKTALVSRSFRVGAAVLGVVLLLLGAFAFAVPFIAGLAADVVFGAVLIAAGVIRIAYAVAGRGAPRVGISALLGLLAIVAGGLLLLRPVLGLFALTLVLGIYFFAHGLLELFAALQWRRRKQPWGWMLFGGLLALALGVFIVVGWPITGLFAVGVFLAVQLVIAGVGLLVASAASGPEARRGAPAATRTPAPA